MKQNTKTLIFTLLLLVSVTLGSAQSVWKNPGNIAPYKEVDVPVNQGSAGQSKTGQLVASGIFNKSGAFLTYANVVVGSAGPDYAIGTSDDYDAPAYFFGDAFFKKMVRSGSAENQLCVASDGRVKVCNGVEFSALQPKYYTSTNTVSFPSSGVTGYVKYKIPNGVSCSKTATADTDWSSGSISGESNSYPIKFDKWGAYQIKMTCDGVEYLLYIDIGGKIVPTSTGVSTNYTLNLGASRSAYIYATGAGGSGANETGSCVTGYAGGNTTIKIGSTDIVTANGGKGAVAGIVSGCNPKVGTGGNATGSNSMTNKTTRDGYDGYNEVGGCSGAPDSAGSYNTCNGSGTNLPYGKAGTGVGNDSYGGGGGGHVSGYYTLPATGTLTTFVGVGGGQGGATPKGQNGYISIIW